MESEFCQGLCVKRGQVPRPPVQVALPQLFTSFCVVTERRNDLQPSTKLVLSVGNEVLPRSAVMQSMNKQ